MACRLLFYRESSTFNNSESFVDKNLWYSGLEAIVIDREGGRRSKVIPTYTTITEFLSDKQWDDYTLYWFDEKGTVILDELDHPIDKVIYCIGSDVDGFDGKDVSTLRGSTVRIRYPTTFFAVQCVPIICYDRYLKFQGRRC
ncbi:MAG: hypothetical protein ACXADB_00515 [Candidatus Hermodarchaeia archaeon]